MNPDEDAVAFRVSGMDCAEEVAVLKRVVGPLVGGEDRLGFDLINGRMTVRGGAGRTAADAIVAAVADTGMTARPWREKDAASAERELADHRRRLLLTGGSGVLWAAGFAVHAVMAGGVAAALGSEGMGVAEAVPTLARILYAVGILCGTWQVLPKAWAALRGLRPDMNLLMVIAVAGAVAIGEWFEGATVAFLFAVSLTLESWTINRARRAIAALMDLTPPTAHVLAADGSTAETPAEQVAVGSRFLVKPGERIPLDGQVVRGVGAVDQAPITGESVPVSKAPGDPVFAGTVNVDSALEVESTKAASDTTLAGIIRMVGDAQAERAPSEQWVERFARVYTPAVLVLAMAVLLVPPLLLQGAWSDWLYRALVLLVIACPCALVISTPVSIVAALTAAARNGVLIKGGPHIESPAGLKAMAFDKTGTLTLGRPEVVEVVPLGGHTADELVRLAAAIESRSDHPIARAVLAFAAERKLQTAPAEEVQTIQGKGATGKVGGKIHWLGSHRYLEERKMETPEIHERLERMTAAGRTVVVVGNDEHVCGFLAVADAVRPEARATLAALRAEGVGHLVMLTGDNAGTAKAVAAQVGIDDVRAELLPADKVAAVAELVGRFGRVGMAGDGVNDAPAMAKATVSIAMGAAGSDAAVETSDIALMSDDLSKLPWLVRHSRRTLAVIRQNIVLSLVVKAGFVLLTVLGHASLWSAIAADMGVSLLVVFNALRLLKGRSKP